VNSGRDNNCRKRLSWYYLVAPGISWAIVTNSATIYFLEFFEKYGIN